MHLARLGLHCHQMTSDQMISAFSDQSSGFITYCNNSLNDIDETALGMLCAVHGITD